MCEQTMPVSLAANGHSNQQNSYFYMAFLEAKYAD